MMKNKAHEKGYRNKPLTEEQKVSNHKKSKTRARVVPPLAGRLYRTKHEWFNSSVGRYGYSNRNYRVNSPYWIISISNRVNLTYNLFRYEQVVRLNILQN